MSALDSLLTEWWGMRDACSARTFSSIESMVRVVESIVAAFSMTALIEEYSAGKEASPMRQIKEVTSMDVLLSLELFRRRPNSLSLLKSP